MKAFETPPVHAGEALDRTSKPVPIAFTIPIDRVLPGRYDCQITVIDPAAARAAFWQTAIAIVP